MSIGALKHGIMPVALTALLWLCGCATPEAPKSAENDDQQAADTAQVIVVPVFILGSPQNAPNGGRGVLPPPGSPDEAAHHGVSLPAKM